MHEMFMEMLGVFKDIALHGAGDADIIDQTAHSEDQGIGQYHK